MRFRVYVASTGDDLEEHRQSVLRAIRRSQKFEAISPQDAAGESSAAGERRIGDVADCDIFVGLLAYRYGSCPPEADQSRTELEYRSAVHEQKPRRLFLMDDDHPWPRSMQDTDPARILALRQELKNDTAAQAAFFGDPDDLAQRVMAALTAELDDLQARRSSGQEHAPAPAATGGATTSLDPQTSQRPYLQWLIEMHELLEVRGVQHPSGGILQVPLEQVYVALKADQANPLERAEARRALEAELFATIEAGDFTAAEAQDALWYHIAGSPVMPTLEVRDRDPAFEGDENLIVNLGEACRQNRRLAILGDPGSGKTTLARWLILVTAKALLAKADAVEVPLSHIDPEAADDDSPFVLGPPRLPILIRIAEYVDDRRMRIDAGMRPRSLMEFLGRQSWLGSLPCWNDGDPGRSGTPISPDLLNQLMQQAIEDGRALVVLDGLDEIPASAHRDAVVEEVDAFARRWMKAEYRISLQRTELGLIGELAIDPPVGDTGNQLIVTSRIAGYHASPLRGNVTHVTVEKMSDPALDQFIRTWMVAVHRQLRAPGEPDYRVVARAHTEAERMRQVVYAPYRRRVRELASNPLLAGVLSMLFHANNGTLPERRVAVYEMAVKNLMDVWRRRHGDPDELELLACELFDVLEPIAAHIHEHEPKGLIPENRLRDLATRYLAESRGEEPDRPTVALRRSVESLIRVLREDVGLLAARGEGVYGFLHLTFQEYLAARWLVRDPQTAPGMLMSRVDDPRWREPLLMALGHASEVLPSQFVQLVSDILDFDGHLRDLLPQSSLLLVDALPEIEDVPAQVVVEIADRLLRAGEDREGIDPLPRLQKLLVTAFRKLLDFGHEHAVERCFRDALTVLRPDRPHRPPAAAVILAGLDWITDPLAAALIRGLPHDAAEWNWPICGLLRKLVTPPDGEIPPYPQKPSDDPRIEQLQTELAEATDEQTREEISLKLDLLVAAADAAKESYQTLKAEYDARQKELIENELPLRVELPLTELPFRFTLEQTPELVERIVTDPDWFRLVVALYGGFRDYRTAETIRDYQQIAAYLQLEDAERAPFAVYYRETWDRDDPVYNMAVYLDERSGLLKHQWNLRPEFRPSAIFRDSTFTREILNTLQAGRSPETLRPVFEAAWRQERRECSDRGAEAVLGLLALGIDISPLLEEDCPAAVRARHRIGELQASLQDPAARALQNVHPMWINLSSRWDITSWAAMVRATMSVAVDCGTIPISAFDRKDGPREDRPWVLAEQIVHRICGWGDDAVYSAADMADKLRPRSSDEFDYEQAWLRLPEANNLRWPLYNFHWPLEPLPPATVDEDDIPICVFSAIEHAPSETSFASVWALTRVFASRIKRNPELLPEALAVALEDAGRRNDRDEVFSELAPHLVGNSNAPLTIAGMATELETRYYRARALIRVARHCSVIQSATLDEAAKVAHQIDNPHHRQQVMEILCREVADHARPALIEACREATGQIENPNDRARAWGRLAFLMPASESAELFRRALESADQIVEEPERAETLALLRPWAEAFPELATVLEEMCCRFHSDTCRAMACSREGEILRKSHVDLANTDEPHCWNAIVLYGLAQDALAGERILSGPRIWFDFANDPTPDRQQTLLQQLGQDPIPATGLTVLALDRVLQSDHPELAFPLLRRLEHATPETTPTLRRWLSGLHPEAASMAALLLAEFRGLSVGLIAGIEDLLQAPDDLSRHRAGRVIHRGVVADFPPRRISNLNPATLYELHRRSRELSVRLPAVALSLSWLDHNVLHDDPRAYADWLRRGNADGDDGRVCRHIIEHVEAMTDDVWSVLLTELPNVSPRLQTAIVLSLARMAHRTPRAGGIRLDAHRAREIARVVPQLDQQPLDEKRYLVLSFDDFIEAAAAAIADAQTIDPAALVPAARAHLFRSCRRSIADLLCEPDEIHLRLESFGSQMYARPGALELATQAIQQGPNDPRIRDLLIHWIIALLQEGVRDADRPAFERSWLLELLAAAAHLAPATFTEHPCAAKLEPLLILTAEYSDSFPARGAAIRLLGYLRRVSPPVLHAIRSGLRDVTHVQEATIVATQLFRGLDDILPQLYQMLRDPSAMTAYATARLLTTLGRSGRTLSSVRKPIVESLADMVRDPASQRAIHFWYVDAKVPGVPLLNDACFSAMLQVSGIE